MKSARPAPTPLPSFRVQQDSGAQQRQDSAEQPSGQALQGSKRDVDANRHTRTDAELQHAAQTIDLYEKQVADLLSSLRKADQNWERAELVRASLGAVLVLLTLCMVLSGLHAALSILIW